jgi:hypothetical protein
MTVDVVLRGAQLRKGKQPDSLSEREVAQYTADIMLELRQLARNVKLNTLQGLIELCYYEAFSVANQPQISKEERERLAQLERARGVA